jgi:hypothetical protein
LSHTLVFKPMVGISYYYYYYYYCCYYSTYSLVETDSPKICTKTLEEK